VSYDELLIALRDLLFENNDDARMLKEWLSLRGGDKTYFCGDTNLLCNATYSYANTMLFTTLNWSRRSTLRLESMSLFPIYGLLEQRAL
jgi:hypothetical protein